MAAANNLALVYKQQGKYAEAATLLTSFLERDADNTTLHYNLGLVYQEIGDLERASMHFTRVIDLEPNGSERSERARRFLINGDFLQEDI